MLASDIIKRARSIADVPNSQFISYSDELESMWESYKDIYSKITDTSDDYFISTAILDTGTATQLGINEWIIDLPADIYKIRFIDYMDNGAWINMDKFNTQSRNKSYGRPMYRTRSNKLWIIGSGFPASIRIDYYPPPVKPSLPEADYSYCISYPQYDATKITSPNFFSARNANLSDNTDYLLYVYDTTSIRLESTTFNSVTTLYTNTGLSNVQYNLGYIYFMKGGDIWRASTNLTSTIVPANLTSTANITDYSITGGKLYFSTATETKSANLDGTGVSAALYGYQTKGISVIGLDIYFIKVSDGLIYKNGESIAILANYLSTDGSYLYYTDSASVLHKYSAIEDIILRTNVAFSGSAKDNFISIINDKLEIYAISTTDDTDFVYPLNEANEIMAYQCGIDFKRKQNGDVTLLAARLGEIWDRFMDVLRRDEGQPERRVSEFPHWNY